MYLHESIAERRRKFTGTFTKRELKNPVTKESVIEKYIQLCYLERYPFGVPPNLIRLDRAKVNTIQYVFVGTRKKLEKNLGNGKINNQSTVVFHADR